MKLLISESNTNTHSEMITGISISNNLNNIVSVSDDKQMIIWDAQGKVSLFGAYPLNSYPTCVEFVKDTIIVGFSDGNLAFMNRNGNVEKTIEAHKGAVIGLHSSNDSTCFLSFGEDGSVKVWSKSGSLRSQVATTDKPI